MKKKAPYATEPKKFIRSDEEKAATRWVFECGGWRHLSYRGYHIGKMPLDLWILGEVLLDIVPALVIEFGSQRGGSALWMADWMDLHQFSPDCKIASVDMTTRDRPIHPRITWLRGKVLSDGIKLAVHALADEAKEIGPVMVIEDSCHKGSHVQRTLETYHGCVTSGSYFCVEDTVLDSLMNPAKPGPARGVNRFLRTHKDFHQDDTRHKFGVGFHRGGWLKRG